jgi:hypothetical protein
MANSVEGLRARGGLLGPADLPLSAVQWSALVGSIAVLVWSVPGLIVNPDFAVGAGATSVKVLAVDMNGWHAVSGFLVGIPGLVATWRRRWSAFFVVQAAIALSATAIWALLSTRPVGGLFYFPGNVADAILHFATSAIFVAGALAYYAGTRRERVTA